MKLCQLKYLEDAGEKIPIRQRLKKTAAKKIVDLLIGEDMQISVAHQSPPDGPGGKPRRGNFSLGLKEGDLVRVKSVQEIRTFLNSEGKFQGLAFTVAQEKYCGQTFRVFKRVEKMFDERLWKLSRIKNTVLLEGVYCDGAGGIVKEWDGCDRRCFLFWKEAWLERVPEE